MRLCGVWRPSVPCAGPGGPQAYLSPFFWARRSLSSSCLFSRPPLGTMMLSLLSCAGALRVPNLGYIVLTWTSPCPITMTASMWSCGATAMPLSPGQRERHVCPVETHVSCARAPHCIHQYHFDGACTTRQALGSVYCTHYHSYW